jgi:hypothetical protein
MVKVGKKGEGYGWEKRGGLWVGRKGWLSVGKWGLFTCIIFISVSVGPKKTSITNVEKFSKKNYGSP